MIALNLNNNSNCRFYLSTGYVLTAKHCVLEFPNKEYDVILGDYSRTRKDSTERKMSVVEVVNHPLYDAAILKLNCQPELSSAIDLIDLSDHVPGVNLTVRAVGFGWTFPSDPNSLADSLQKIDLPVASDATCNAEDHLNVQTYEFCAGSGDEGYANVCHGDSGGAVMTVNMTNGDIELIGITARGVRNCVNTADYAVFLRISAIHEWIDENMTADVEPCPTSGSTSGYTVISLIHVLIYIVGCYCSK